MNRPSASSPITGSEPSTLHARPSAGGYFRWVICALLFFAATINYIDRQVIGILKPALVEKFGWSDERIYSSIVFSFQFAYALGFMAAGRVMDRWGWQWAFIGTGMLGFFWVGWWLAVYRLPENHPRLSAAELAYIRSDPSDPVIKIPWRRLLPHRQTWAFAIGKFMTDPIWWLYLFWVAADGFPRTCSRRAGPRIARAKRPC
jgi:MFS family permease